MASSTGGVSVGAGQSDKRSHEGAEQGESGSAKRSKSDVAGLPTRQYLDQTVVPILLQVGRKMYCFSLVDGGHVQKVISDRRV